MVLKYKPKFRRDLLQLKGKAQLSEKVFAVIKQIKSASSLSEIPGYKSLDEYKIRFRIKIKISDKEDYRMGLIIKNNIIWAERILPRPNFYKFYRR